jgi:glucosamine--fructose-6-phosphate aminotransferase (isomerizing)
MCGIIGYTGKREVESILLGGLQRLVYRGYDSAGLAIQNGRGIGIRKKAGPVECLAEALKGQPLHGTTGIGHTRWATHGVPNDTNAHPHVDCTGDIALVHNGIIENAEVLRSHLQRRGHRFNTQTDTEVIGHLIEEEAEGPLENRVRSALRRVEGTYGLAVMSASEPHKIVVARRGSPVLLGVGDNEFFVSSDVAGVLDHTNQVVYLEDGEMAVLTPEGFTVVAEDEAVRDRSPTSIDWELEELTMGDHDHFMQKEIYEQPDALRRALAGRLTGGADLVHLGGINLTDDQIRDLDRIIIVACGTSWHAGLVGRTILETLTGIPVQVEYASEFRYAGCLDGSRALTIAISQSGETADTLEAMRVARKAGSRVAGLVNVVGSTIARESQSGIYLRAGPEVSVASTKAFTNQIAALLLLALHIARRRRGPSDEASALARELRRLPELTCRALETESQMRNLATEIAGQSTVLFLGRGISFPTALEGALKLKEISYIHAEGYPAAEVKHGPIALVEDGVPVVVVAPRDELFHKTLSNAQEVRTRGGRTILVTTEAIAGERTDLADVADHVVTVPRIHPLLSPAVAVIPLQLLAYHTALLRGCNVDRPRNLAKSVTVE